MNYHIEVHSRDRQIEHYLIQDGTSVADATSLIREFYREKGQRIGLWDSPDDRNDIRIPYLIFRVEELEVDRPVIYIAGEYRPAYPI